MNTTATIIITIALVFYSVGVWGEKISGRLKRWHFIFFVLGFTFDTLGTGMMLDMAGGMSFDIHGISGAIAILLMLIHAVWAFFVLFRRNEKKILVFHKFSFVVWIIWLIPFFSPMVFSLPE